MKSSPNLAPAQLTLSENVGAIGESAPWIGPLLALGARSARYADHHSDRQLVIALSVPSRDFSAALVGCGWVMTSKAQTLGDPLEILRSLSPGTPIRAVNDRHVVTGFFSSLTESASPPRANFAGSTWLIDKICALSVLPELEKAERTLRPEVGSVGRMARLDQDWDARLAAPAADLAIVGTFAWLKEDFEAWLGRGGEDMSPSSIRALLLPNVGRVATWFTRVYASARFADQLPLPSGIRAVILDGAGAIKHISEIESQVVICILDRSVADETAAEIVVQLRNTRSEPLSITDDLRWSPPTGVEALAFTVPL